jgi:membrane protein implicated in regulation of membrane protease activity
MDTRSESTSPADLASAAGGLIVGLGTLTVAFFPFALPLLVLVIGPLAVLALAGLMLALPIVLPLWLGRLALRALRRRREARPVELPLPNEGDRPTQVPGGRRARGKVVIDV